VSDHPTDPAPTAALPREAPTRPHRRGPRPPRPPEPPAQRPRREGPTWPAVILGVACGILLGALVVLALSPGGDTTTVTQAAAARTVTQTVTAPAPAPSTTNPGTVVIRTLVPDVVGQRLDIAKDQLEERRFTVDVDGGGLLGVLNERNWRVTEQTPTPGIYLEQGSSVLLKIARG
jgi:hypothetical protein